MANRKKAAPTSAASTEDNSTATQVSSKGPPGLTRGRDVHYHDGTTEKDGKTLVPMAAKVADVLEHERGRCNLTLFLPSGATKPLHDVPYSDKPAASTWSYMARV